MAFSSFKIMAITKIRVYPSCHLRISRNLPSMIARTALASAALLFCATGAMAQGIAGIGNYPSMIANAPDDAWVPVVVLNSQGAKSETLLGLAQVSDIENGLPYKIGIFQLNANSASSLRLSAGQMTLTPVCQNSAPAGVHATGTDRCQQLVGVVSPARGVEISGSYKLGPLRFDAGVMRADRAYTQALNPYLPWPVQLGANLAPGAYQNQTTIKLASTLDSGLGKFSLGIANSKNAFWGNESQIGLSWFGSTFGSSLVARVFDSKQGANWSGLDLGVSWRTPWQGVFRVGASNVLVSGKPPALLDPKRAAQEGADLDRVPYVRYEQDL
jgi:hypothetical protein